jgi:hypothetical protein
MSVRVQTTPVFTAATPTKVFDGQYFAGIVGRTYDESLDGKRFLMIKSASTDVTATPADMVVVLNWTEELRENSKNELDAELPLQPRLEEIRFTVPRVERVRAV